VSRISKTHQILTALFLLYALTGIAADETTVPVTLAWAGCPTADGDGNPCAEAVHYNVYLQVSGMPEELVGTVRQDTTFTLDAERGVVQRVRVVGVDASGRPSEPSEWSDPIYIEVERSSGGGTLPPPETAKIGNAHPNPFNPETVISYGVPEDMTEGTRMSLEIYNLRGQRIRTFEVDPSPGWHEVQWNGLDDSGRPQSTGTYLARYICGTEAEVTKMTMVK